ncbi:hypothetical protein IKO50_01775 [bacterium]|nr:hypothetical protein [bacterium]
MTKIQKKKVTKTNQKIEMNEKVVEQDDEIHDELDNDEPEVVENHDKKIKKSTKI